MDEDFVGLNVGNRHVLENEGLVIFLNAGGFHGWGLSRISGQHSDF
jgi:hypothetical protein